MRSWMARPAAGDTEGSTTSDLRLCCTYHEHDFFGGRPLPPPLLARLRRATGFWFHPERARCRTCVHAGPGADLPKYIVFDTETTGSSKEDVVIQLGFVVFDSSGREVQRYEEIWQSDRPSNPWAQKVHQIAPAEVKASRTGAAEGLAVFQAALRRVAESGGLAVAHNYKFDHRLLQQTAAAAGVHLDWCTQSFCTAAALKHRSVEERGPNCKNGDVYTYLGGEDLGQMHRALVDARATAHIFFCGQDAGWW